MENRGCMFSGGSNADYVAGRIIMEYAICATLHSIRAWRGHEIEARTKFRIHIICIAVSIVRHHRKVTVKLHLLWNCCSRLVASLMAGKGWLLFILNNKQGT